MVSLSALPAGRRGLLEVILEFRVLDMQQVDQLALLCGGCVYWELPQDFDGGLTANQARLMKAEWVCSHAAELPVGRMALCGGKAIGFIQFGPPGLYPRCLEYDSGPVSDDALFITCLFVEPGSRGSGVARGLLGQAGEVARKLGYAALETFARRGSSNNPSGPVELYEACGFRIIRDGSEFPLVRLEIPLTTTLLGGTLEHRVAH
jgi:GNAT superfamily N-acetyltransferase